MKNLIGVPLEGLADLSRIAAAQGAVLLKNENKTLPIHNQERVSVFGRIQTDYYRSGTGSGGAVNVFSRILDAASSIKSIALSGKNLSVIYLADNVAAASIAASVMPTL